jgi:hypothetical protein
MRGGPAVGTSAAVAGQVCTRDVAGFWAGDECNQRRRFACRRIEISVGGTGLNIVNCYTPRPTSLARPCVNI